MTTTAQHPRITHEPDGRWSIHAPAKINLGLRVFPPRPDGFHDVETWMVPLSWHDTLFYHSAGPAELRVTGRAEGVPTEMEKNLVGRAVLKLSAAAQRHPTGQIELHKVIPHGGGLGGGSSDAAQALVLLNEVWNLHYEPAKLAAIAAELGSDVSFFVAGLPALCTGRGEITTPLRPMHPLYAVLILPTEGLPTKPVYQAFDAGNRMDRKEKIPWQQWATLDAAALNKVLINDLEPAAFSVAPWLRELQTSATTIAHQKVHMTGSGSTLYTLCTSAPKAADLAERLSSDFHNRATCLPVRVLS